MTGGYAFGTWLALMLTLLNSTAFIVKKCIYDKGQKTKERQILIYWLCCLKIGALQSSASKYKAQ